ncbi:uncharacterized protein LOC110973516 isoform X2 [Acanthaster planci]|uniref:Uncharacterized protein LOC110973516 isoform X2 n=1 Tax=Acanthaster planci TaxID=133434 RepID=A0A8B7XH22_ACAPL|nr:uncharacterized protein LOC110973516 isoform X2 [Acanthaster planci]
MAAAYYCVLVATLLLAAVNGQVDDVTTDAEPQMNVEGLRPLGSMIQNVQLCSLCEKVIGFLKNVTNNKQVLEELVELLLPVCQWAPYSLHGDCIEIVDNIPEMVKNLTDMYLDPKRDCAYVCPEQEILTYEPYAAPMANILKLMQEKKPGH